MTKKVKKKFNYGRMITFILLLLAGAVWIVHSNSGFAPKKVAARFEPLENPIHTEKTQQEELPEQDTTGMKINPLTGLYIDEEHVEHRPVAVMINNHKRAIPQRGIGSADIMYEIPVEGEFVRLMAVFQNYDIEQIGPVRSARHYFIDSAFDNDALYLHFGQSEYAFKYLKEWGSPNLNALAGVLGSPGKYLEHVRDAERKKTKGLEHSAFTSGEMIKKSWDRSGYRENVKNGYEPLLKFSDEDVKLGGEEANIITIPYSGYQKSVFEYDEDKKVYMRSQFGAAHIDELTGEQLKAKNIIIQYTDIHQIPGDKKLCKEVDTIGSGRGVYITNGKMKPIKWSKIGHHSPTQWMYEDGTKVEFNKGKTWISLVDEGMESEVVLSK